MEDELTAVHGEPVEGTFIVQISVWGAYEGQIAAQTYELPADGAPHARLVLSDAAKAARWSVASEMRMTRLDRWEQLTLW